jgi:hypothetical protein
MNKYISQEQISKCQHIKHLSLSGCSVMKNVIKLCGLDLKNWLNYCQKIRSILNVILPIKSTDNSRFMTGVRH